MRIFPSSRDTRVSHEREGLSVCLTRTVLWMGNAQRTPLAVSGHTFQVDKSVKAGLSTCRAALGQRHTAPTTAALDASKHTHTQPGGHTTVVPGRHFTAYQRLQLRTKVWLLVVYGHSWLTLVNCISSISWWSESCKFAVETGAGPAKRNV